MRFVALGDVMVDVACAELPSAGTRVHADVVVRAGGSAVNAATSAVERRAAAAVIGRVGSDSAGELVLRTLREEGIEPLLARDEELPTGATVALGGGEGAAIVAHRGANARLSEVDVPERLVADVLLVSGFALLQEGSADAARAGLRRFTGQWAAVDLASPRLAARADVPALAADANVVFATAEEAKAVTGLDPDEAVRALAAQFTVACVKLGADGAVAAQGKKVDRAAAAPVRGRSPFGAGDAFAAAFLVALGGGESVMQALEHACEAGALAAQRL